MVQPIRFPPRRVSTRVLLPGLILLSLAATGAGAQESPGSGPENAQPIRPGQTIPGTLAMSDDYLPDNSYYDLYRFEASAGQRYILTLRSADFDAFLALGRQNGGGFSELVTDDDGADGTDSEIRWVAHENGVYLIRANSLSGGETGAYTLSLEAAGTVELRPATVRPMRSGTTVQGTLTEGDPILDDASHFHLYEFDAAAGERYVVTLRSGDFDAYLALGPMRDGQLDVRTHDDDSGGGHDARIVWTATEDGPHVVRVNTFGSNSTGAYTLSVETAPPAPALTTASGQPLRSGETVAGTLAEADPLLDEGGHYDLYRIEAGAGDRIILTLRSGAFDTLLGLGRADDGVFVEVAQDDDSGGGTDARLEWTADRSGTYFVRATSYSAGQTGGYTLTLERDVR